MSSLAGLNPPRDHHRLPQWYLRRFADAQKRLVVVRSDGSRKLCAVKRASVVRDFYAFVGDDGHLDQSVEVGIGPIEAAGAWVTRTMLAGTFPPSDEDRLEFAGFLALQTTRGEMFRREWERLVAGHGAVPLRNVTIETMLRDLAQLANIFLRMRWRLCRFPEPALFTGDQPVMYKRPGTSPRFFEGIGPMTAQEVRFVLDPQHALVLTWEGGWSDERIYEHDLAVAASLNAFTARWCEHELYCHPELVAQLPTGPVEPLPASVGPAEADALVAYLARFPNWRVAAIVADAPDWGDPNDGYGVHHPRRIRANAPS